MMRVQLVMYLFIFHDELCHLFTHNITHFSSFFKSTSMRKTFINFFNKPTAACLLYYTAITRCLRETYQLIYLAVRLEVI